MTPEEIYRVSRIRLAQQFHIDPMQVDKWDIRTYYDAMAVLGADEALAKLKG